MPSILVYYYFLKEKIELREMLNRLSKLTQKIGLVRNRKQNIRNGPTKLKRIGLATSNEQIN